MWNPKLSLVTRSTNWCLSHFRWLVKTQKFKSPRSMTGLTNVSFKWWQKQYLVPTKAMGCHPLIELPTLNYFPEIWILLSCLPAKWIRVPDFLILHLCHGRAVICLWKAMMLGALDSRRPQLFRTTQTTPSYHVWKALFAVEWLQRKCPQRVWLFERW